LLVLLFFKKKLLLFLGRKLEFGR